MFGSDTKKTKNHPDTFVLIIVLPLQPLLYIYPLSPSPDPAEQETKYSRIPVYSGEIDRISGVVLSKDLLDFVQVRQHIFLPRYVRTVYTESERLLSFFPVPPFSSLFFSAGAGRNYTPFRTAPTNVHVIVGKRTTFNYCSMNWFCSM